jgi:hypothetical protein
MDPALLNSQTRYTYADCLTWPEDARHALIDDLRERIWAHYEIMLL